jgi:glycogen(starch) synthase
MRIAIFSSSFAPHLGGVEELVRQLAHHYRQAGHEPVVVTNRWPQSLPAQETHEGIPVYRYPFRIPEGPLRARARYLASVRSVRNAIAMTLRAHDVEIVHVQCVSSNGLYAKLAARELGLPLIVTAQGERTMDADRIYERSPFMNGLLRNLLATGTHITACSRDTLEDLERFAGSSFGARATVIYNGINAAEFAASGLAHDHPRPYVFAIGRWVPQKGFDVLLRAFAEAAEHPWFEHDLLLAGEGEQRQALETLVRDLGLRDRVHLLGRADRPTAVRLFKGCSFVVLPSRHEPFGIVNVEAMAAGKALIATRVGGVAEFVTDGRNGILIQPDDPQALGAAMMRLAGDPALRERLAADGLSTASRFDWARITDEYLAVYEASTHGAAQ